MRRPTGHLGDGSGRCLTSTFLQVSFITTLRMVCDEIRVGGVVVSASPWSDPRCSTCWLSGTSTWSNSLKDPHGTLCGKSMFHLTLLTHLGCLSSVLTHLLSSVTHLSVYLRFHEDEHNCFTFCLQFLNSVLAVEGRSALSREDFTRSFILPRMKRASKYTTLIQHLQEHRYYMVDRQETETQGDVEEESSPTS